MITKHALVIDGLLAREEVILARAYVKVAGLASLGIIDPMRPLRAVGRLLGIIIPLIESVVGAGVIIGMYGTALAAAAAAIVMFSGPVSSIVLGPALFFGILAAAPVGVAALLGSASIGVLTHNMKLLKSLERVSGLKKKLLYAIKYFSGMRESKLKQIEKEMFNIKALPAAA